MPKPFLKIKCIILGKVGGHMKKLLMTLVVSLVYTFLFSACTSTHMVSSWKESDIKANSFKKYFVICVNNNNSKRRGWEDAIVRALNAHHVKAVASYKIFPKSIPDSTELNKHLKGEYDAVLMIHKIDEETRKYLTPGYAAIYPFFGFRNRFFHSYAYFYNQVYYPPRVEREKIYQLETNIYEPKEDGRLIWTAVTETRNPSSTQGFSREVLELLIPQMVKDKILPGLN